MRGPISASHLQDAVADEEQAGELGWERGREMSRGNARVTLAEAGGITTYLFVLLISLISRQGFYAPPRPEEATTRWRCSKTASAPSRRSRHSNSRTIVNRSDLIWRSWPEWA